MKVERLVLDTNVLISAALSPAGAPSLLLDHLHRSRTVLVFSEPTMAELSTRLLRLELHPWRDIQILRHAHALEMLAGF